MDLSVEGKVIANGKLVDIEGKLGISYRQDREIKVGAVRFMHYFSLLAQTDMPQELDFGMMIVRMLIFLGLVLILIYFVLRKGLPLLVNPSVYGSRAVKILERIPVDQKRTCLWSRSRTRFT